MEVLLLKDVRLRSIKYIFEENKLLFRSFERRALLEYPNMFTSLHAVLFLDLSILINYMLKNLPFFPDLKIYIKM